MLIIGKVHIPTYCIITVTTNIYTKNLTIESLFLSRTAVVVFYRTGVVDVARQLKILKMENMELATCHIYRHHLLYFIANKSYYFALS
jgi:hypothetical protein